MSTNNKNNIAIVAVCYNRIDSLTRLLDSLTASYYPEEATLIISVDKSKTTAVEEFADSYNWIHGPKIVDKHEKNLGLRPHMMSLGKWFDQFDAIIVLEDDIVVSKNFYFYAQQTVYKYCNDENIAGISLYGYESIPTSGYLFQPLKDENDVFFMKYAISWGEIWMKKSWNHFYEWYRNNQDLSMFLSIMPSNMRLWDKRSWLKYHMAYCLSQNKYFVHPYVSLATNFDDVGEHVLECSSKFQVALQRGLKKEFSLGDFSQQSVRYDIFFENEAIYSSLGMSKQDLCIDLNGNHDSSEGKRYWLTTAQLNYKIVRSFLLGYRPIEVNVIDNIDGSGIYLYDTSIPTKNKFNCVSGYIEYNLHLATVLTIVKDYGALNLIQRFIIIMQHRLTRKLKKRFKK